MGTGERAAHCAIAFLTAVTAFASHAVADDVVLMPFACTVVSGKPVLTPAPDQGHSVLGPRESRKVKTCSTVDTNYCRQWTTFKFDMDCGGTRVAWMQVYANAEDHTRRRVWEAGGQLRVQNTTKRSKRIDDMCARRLGPQMEWGTTSEVCDQASPVNAPNSTVMPPGFAPMLGLDAVIVAMDKLGRYPMARATKPTPATTAALPVEKPAETAAKQPETPAAPVVEDLAAEPPVAVAEATAPVPEAAPKPEAVTHREMQAQPDVAPAATAEAPVAPATPSPGGLPPQDSSAAASQVIEPPVPDVRVADAPVTGAQPAADAVTVINSADPSAVRSDAAPEPAAPPEIAASERTVDPVETTATPAPEAVTTPPVAVAPPPTPVVASDNTLAYAIAAFASAALVMTTLVVTWLRRASIEPTASAPEPPVLQTTEFDVETFVQPLHPTTVAETFSAADAPATTDMTLEPRGALVPLVTRAKPMPARSGAIDLGDRMPANKSEALELLGMGVASDGNLASLKKIIDGLRMNWHPDYAQDEHDRRVREVRLKQINAAWEILEGRAA
jgi:hypothetical protein